MITRYNKRCKRCNKKFNTFSQSGNYCSKECTYINRFERTCTICNKEYLSKSTNGKYCSDECKEINKVQYDKNRRRTRASYGYITDFRIFERDIFTCIYCGKSSIEDAKELEVDHIYPQSKGGEHTISNLVTSCHTCNTNKSDVVLSKEIEIRVLKEVNRRNVALEYV